MTENPFFAPSTLPYKLPPFAEIREEHYLPAFERGMADQLREVEEIANEPGPATFANTVEALERSGQILNLTVTVFMSIASSDATDGIREIETEIFPRLTKHGDSIHLNRALYARIKQVTTENPEEAWLLEKYRVDFVRAGADLSEADQERLRELNEELTRLATTFSQNLLTASTASALVVEDVKQLDGLSESAIKAIEKDGTYVLPLLNFTNQPALAELTDRETRRKLYELSVGRAPENFGLAARMAALRAERAALLGYPHHAAYSVADQTAATTDAVEEMLGKLVAPAVANARAGGRRRSPSDRQDGVTIAPWDWAFYAEQVRTERYDFDAAALRPYFELDRVLRRRRLPRRRSALRHHASPTAPRPRRLPPRRPGLRGLRRRRRAARAVPRRPLRPRRKRGGAWMNSFVRPVPPARHPPGRDEQPQHHPSPPAGEPTLLTFDEVSTALPRVRPRPARPVLRRPLPAVLRHRRAARLRRVPLARSTRCGPLWPEILANYARHHETGEPLPAELVEKIEAAPSSSARASATTRVPRRGAARPGLAPAGAGRGGRATPRRSRARPWSGPGSPSALVPPALPDHLLRSTSSRGGATAPATTPTSGARCSTPTPSTGSRRTAA